MGPLTRRKRRGSPNDRTIELSASFAPGKESVSQRTTAATMATASSQNVVQKYKNQALMVATRPFGEFPHGVYFCEKPGFRKVYAIEKFGSKAFVAIERSKMDPDQIPEDAVMSCIFRSKDFDEEVTMKDYCKDFTSKSDELFLSADGVFVNLETGRILDDRGRTVHKNSSILKNKTLDNCYVIDQKERHMRTVDVTEALMHRFKDFYYACQGFMAAEDIVNFEDL